MEIFKKSDHQYYIEILISHALVMGYVVTSGYHIKFEVFLAYSHLLLFVGIVLMNYFKKNESLFMVSFLVFLVINLILLITAMIKIE